MGGLDDLAATRCALENTFSKFLDRLAGLGRTRDDFLREMIIEREVCWHRLLPRAYREDRTAISRVCIGDRAPASLR